VRCAGVSQRRMRVIAIYVIVGFIIVFFALNAIEYGRLD
jgi:hypothetical protein